MKNRKVIIAAICVVLMLAAAGIWYFTGRQSGGGETAYVQKISQMNPAVLSDRYSGVVESQQTADFRAASGRTIDQIFVVPGQNVAVGTPLFRYSVTDAENKVASANLEIENYSNQISILASSGNSADIQLQIRQLQYEIQVAQQEIAGYQQEIQNADVASTIDGVVKTVNETGIGPDGMEAPIVTVAQTGEFRVKGKVSEQTVYMFSAGMPVIVRSRVDERRTWKGEVTSVETEPVQENSDMYYGSGESSSKYPFYVTLEDTSGLMLGQHVFIEPDWGQNEVKEGIWLDTGYLMSDEDGSLYVWCGTGGRLKKVRVTAGETDPETYRTEILEGLKEDDLIAWPDESFHEGMKAVSVSEVHE